MTTKNTIKMFKEAGVDFKISKDEIIDLLLDEAKTNLLEEAEISYGKWQSLLHEFTKTYYTSIRDNIRDVIKNLPTKDRRNLQSLVKNLNKASDVKTYDFWVGRGDEGRLLIISKKIENENYWERTKINASSIHYARREIRLLDFLEIKSYLEQGVSLSRFDIENLIGPNDDFLRLFQSSEGPFGYHQVFPTKYTCNFNKVFDLTDEHRYLLEECEKAAAKFKEDYQELRKLSNCNKKMRLNMIRSLLGTTEEGQVLLEALYSMRTGNQIIKKLNKG